MRLSRDKIQRMINAGGGSSSGGGGGSDIAGGVTQAWVNQNYVSIEFFRKVFKVWAAGETSSDPDVEIMPNDIASTVKNIQAQAGLWTEQFLSALGNGGGGGTGGASSLDQLDDVVITSPTNWQALIYNATTQMWVNGTIQSGTDMATVWSALAAATSEQINASHLSGVLADYVTATSLQTILGDYLTQTSADQRYITIAYFDRLFRAYNGSTLVSHNDTTTTIDNIKAMFGFWTDMYLSALGRNSAATGLGIDNLTDVTINTPTDGQVLQYNATSSKWENATIQTVVALSGLTDVLLTNPAANQVLVYDGTQWVNSSVKTVNGYSIIGTGDIPASGGGTGNYLPLAGGTMTGTINATLPSSAFANASSNSYTDRRHCSILYGVSNSANNTGYTAFHYKGNGSTNNYITFGFWGNDEVFNIKANGNVGIMTNDPSARLSVSSTTGYAISINTADSYDSYIQCFLNSTLRAEVGYSHNMSFLSCQPNGARIGVNDAGNPVYKTAWNGTESVLLHSRYNYLNEATFILNNNNSTGRINSILIGNYDSAYNCSYISHHCVGISSNTNYVTFGLYGADELLNLTGYGSAGIGTTTPNYKLHVVGDIYATGAITALSDMRDKQVNENTELPIEWIANAPAFSYYWKDKKAHDELLHVGSSAQYWQAVLPEVVLEAKDEKGTLSMQYGVAALVSAITIARKVVDHEQRIKQLEQENEELKKQLNAA